MESTTKILDALGITESDISALDKTQLLILYRLFECAEQFGMFKDRNRTLELASNDMQQQLRSRLNEMGPL
ncbi:hypothetical protein LXA54_16910 [Erwinia amylovora]|uniref:hypothetical protein n=1 Tax=Erwinia amylovora TaxID=552 RepID=UPI0020C02846|nr:hypothetical protein [Erwinia amylovora]MCK8335970.1 hypothetical protein [Erwinia amylovora]